MKRKLFAVLIVLFLPSVCLAQLDRGIKLMVFFNDLVPIVEDQKRHPYEMDRDFFHREIHDRLMPEIKNSSQFLKKIEDNTLIVLTGEVNKPSYKKGVISDEFIYIVYLASANQKTVDAKKLLVTYPIRITWSPPGDLNEILKPKIRETVNTIIKEVIQKK
ncbi:MAG: hypothetical protein V1645_01450 [archaeon]